MHNIKALIDELDALRAELGTLPTGCLVTHKRGEYEYYGRQYYLDGQSKEAYVSAADKPRVESLLKRRKKVKELIKEVRAALKGHNREVKQIRAVQQQEQEAAKRKQFQESQLHNRYHWEELVHYTLRGEFVRSKSELNLANYLHLHGVDYIYEMPLELWTGKIVSPDFSIKVGDQWIFIEHLGRLDEPEYAARWAAKEAAYKAAGIIEGVNLLCTREQNGHLDMQEIDFLFRLYGIVR